MHIGWIIFIVLLVLVIVGVVVWVVLAKEKDPYIWPAPKPVLATQNLHSLDPNNYWYEFRIPGLEHLTNRKVLELLSWDDFSLDSERRLKRELGSIKSINSPLKDREELKDYHERLKTETLAHMDKETNTNRVFSIDLKRLKLIVGDEGFRLIEKYFGPFDKCHIMRLWLNTKDYTTPLHGDMTAIGVLHLTGRKRWVFADQHNMENCYATPNEKGHLYCAPQNPYAQKALSETYPKFSRIRFTHVDAVPGTMYSFPRKMIHFVHTLEPSFMVSFNFYSKDISWPVARE